MNKIKKSYQISILLIAAFFIRVIAYYFFGDAQLENEWKILVHNLYEKNILGFYVLDKDLGVIPKMAEQPDLVLPSAFMPPLYAYIVFIFKYIFSSYFDFVFVIILFQIILSTITCYLFYKIVLTYLDPHISFYTSVIFSLVPISIFACVQISSITIQVFFLTYFLYLLRLFSSEKKIKLKNLIILSLLSGFLILLRGEFILFYILTLIYFFCFFSKKYKLFLSSLIITLFIISPYLMRNYYQFNTFTITKSIGYNLLKGNNPNFKVEGNPTYIENKFNKKDLVIATDKRYEINLDNFYKQEAIKNITSDPFLYFKNYLLKVFSFIFLDFNSSYENYFNVFHILPKIVLSIFSLIGAIISLQKKGYNQYLSLYFFSNIFFFSIFFILPRYSLILLPIQFLLSIQFVKYLNRKFFN